MRITLLKYISKETWAIFLTCLIVFVFIFIASYMLTLTDLMVNYGIGLRELFRLIICKIPGGILFVMPVACLTAVLLSFIRMSTDNEIIALYSSGISLFQLMTPVVLFSFICLLFAGFLTLFWAPYGNRTYESVLKNIVKTGAASEIKERVFFEQNGLVFYINSYLPKDRVMKDVFVADKERGREITIIAKQAKFIPSKNGIVIRFIDGTMFTDEKGGEYSVSSFSPGFLDYPVEIDSMTESSADRAKELDEMYFTELNEFIRTPSGSREGQGQARLTLYEMFSIPAAIFVIGIAGAPLGAQIRSQGRVKGIIISFLLFLCYYITLMTVRYLCENGTIIPETGVWLPVLLLSIICFFLFIRSAD